MTFIEVAINLPGGNIVSVNIDKIFTVYKTNDDKGRAMIYMEPVLPNGEETCLVVKESYEVLMARIEEAQRSRG